MNIDNKKINIDNNINKHNQIFLKWIFNNYISSNKNIYNTFNLGNNFLVNCVKNDKTVLETIDKKIFFYNNLSYFEKDIQYKKLLFKYQHYKKTLDLLDKNILPVMFEYLEISEKKNKNMLTLLKKHNINEYIHDD